MKTHLMTILVAVPGILLCAGCQPQMRTVPPLFTTMPQHDRPPELCTLDVPTPPPSKSMPVSFIIPKKDSSVSPDDSVMRHGAVIKAGSSVVISVPASLYQRSQAISSRGITNELGFRTDGYFNVLEQYIERGLLSVGLQVKDRSKFEAKLRDLRDSGDVIRSPNDAYGMALTSLRKELDSGAITESEFADQARMLRDKLLDPSGTSPRNREEMTDISEVIRAAQDGEVAADYVLQVNDLSVQQFSGTPLQLSSIAAVRAALSQNPGLRIGAGGGHGSMIPETLRQPWAQACFNAKLIEVKTGSIDWIGEYCIESLAVLEDGVRIVIGVRRRTSNARAIVGAIRAYNGTLRSAEQSAHSAMSQLERKYEEVMRPVKYEGTKEQGTQIQNRRRSATHAVEREYENRLREYKSAAAVQPEEARWEWEFVYDVDVPTISPDLLRPKTEEEGQRLLNHVKALGFKVTHDLLKTIEITSN